MSALCSDGVAEENDWAMNASAFTILLVSRDRGALRRLTTVLAMTECRLQQTSQKEQAAALLASDPPDVLILDASPSLRSTLGLRQIADSDRQGRRPYTLVIVDNPTREDLAAAVEAGANDFLTKPVAKGELLRAFEPGGASGSPSGVGWTWVDVRLLPAFPGSWRSSIVCDANYRVRDGKRGRPR